jgi:hypothetical protein
MTSFVTNASRSDAVRIRQTVPRWFRVFGNRIEELVVVYDDAPPVGRDFGTRRGDGDTSRP